MVGARDSRPRSLTDGASRPHPSRQGRAASLARRRSPPPRTQQAPRAHSHRHAPAVGGACPHDAAAGAPTAAGQPGARPVRVWVRLRPALPSPSFNRKHEGRVVCSGTTTRTSSMPSTRGRRTTSSPRRESFACRATTQVPPATASPCNSSPDSRWPTPRIVLVARVARAAVVAGTARARREAAPHGCSYHTASTTALRGLRASASTGSSPCCGLRATRPPAAVLDARPLSAGRVSLLACQSDVRRLRPASRLAWWRQMQRHGQRSASP